MCSSRCCSFESLSCRRRTLKAAGSFLIIFGLVFFLAGVAAGILPRIYNELPDVYSSYILYAFLVPATGMAAVVTGMGSIHMGRIMSDDDCSARGVSILALLTIVCSLASVGVPAWPLYEEGYFLGIPPQTQAMANTTGQLTTPSPITLPPAITTPQDTNSTTNSMDMASTAMSGTNATVMNNVSADAATTGAMPSSMNQSTENVTAGAPDAMSTPAPDNSTTSENSQNSTAPTTADTDSGTTGDATEPMATNSTELLTTAVTREPIPFDQWFDVIVPFGIICLFALLFVLCALLVCCIGCCCSDYSEIVDDRDLYKS